ncbi:MAG: plastocyanin/azurin family copper-binding protein [Acidimicrobiia bacterium]
MKRSRALLLGSIVAFALVLGACGGSSSNGGGSAYVEPAGSPVASIEIDAGNLFFKPNTITVPAGVVQITMKNVQSGVHTLLIRGVSGYMLEVSGNGDTDTKKVDLKPGTYTYYCNIPGHEQAGMKGTMTVTG